MVKGLLAEAHEPTKEFEEFKRLSTSGKGLDCRVSLRTGSIERWRGIGSNNR